MSLLTDITEKNFSEQDQFIPLSLIWQPLDGRLSHERLEEHLDELQTTLIKKGEFLAQANETNKEQFVIEMRTFILLKG